MVWGTPLSKGVTISFLNMNAFACLNAMKRFTVSIPKDLKKRMDQMPEVNWPEVAKQAVLKKLKEIKTFEMMVREGKVKW